MVRVGIKHERKYAGTCAWCGSDFLAAHPRAAMCSENCRKKASADRNRAPCPECGHPMGITARRQGNQRCLDCRRTKERKEKGERAEQFAQWWADGETLAQIGERVGWTVNHVQVRIYEYRQQGYDFPYRHTEETRKRMRSAWRGEGGL